MKTIEVGNEYRDGRGRLFRIVAEGVAPADGCKYYVGVRAVASMFGIETVYFREDGVKALGSDKREDLQLLDWRDLQQDDVIELSRGMYTVRRYVCRVEDDAIVVYGDGVSSLTFDGSFQEAVRCRPTEFVRVIKKNPDPTQ